MCPVKAKITVRRHRESEREREIETSSHVPVETPVERGFHLNI